MLQDVRAIIVAALAGILVSSASARAEGCVPWSQAGPIIAKNGLVPAKSVYQSVQSRAGGKIVKASLCDRGGNFVYKFVVLGADGVVNNVTVDARTGR